MTNTKKPRRWVELEVLLDRSAMSQGDLHRMTGLSRSFISDMIVGRRGQLPKHRKTIAAALRVPEVVLIPALEEK